MLISDFSKAALTKPDIYDIFFEIMDKGKQLLGSLVD